MVIFLSDRTKFVSQFGPPKCSTFVFQRWALVPCGNNADSPGMARKSLVIMTIIVTTTSRRTMRKCEKTHKRPLRQGLCACQADIMAL